MLSPFLEKENKKRESTEDSKSLLHTACRRGLRREDGQQSKLVGWDLKHKGNTHTFSVGNRLPSSAALFVYVISERF